MIATRIAPLPAGEISPPETRGVVLCFEQASIVLGVVVGFWTGAATRTSKWRARSSGRASAALTIVLRMHT
jgi:hypothetical protein